MATASKTEAKAKAAKSPIPKRILTRIDSAFSGYESHEVGRSADSPTIADGFRKKIAREKKDVLAYIEELIAKSSD